MFEIDLIKNWILYKLNWWYRTKDKCAIPYIRVNLLHLESISYIQDRADIISCTSFIHTRLILYILYVLDKTWERFSNINKIELIGEWSYHIHTKPVLNLWSKSSCPNFTIKILNYRLEIFCCPPIINLLKRTGEPWPSLWLK